MATRPGMNLPSTDAYPRERTCVASCFGRINLASLFRLYPPQSVVRSHRERAHIRCDTSLSQLEELITATRVQLDAARLEQFDAASRWGNPNMIWI